MILIINMVRVRVCSKGSNGVNVPWPATNVTNGAIQNV